MERLTYDEFLSKLRSSKRAWHLELRDTYNVAAEDEPFGRYLTGEPDDYEWLIDWLNVIRSAVRDGVSVERLRVVSVPHTDYTSWGLSIAPQNIAAGEDVRYLRRDLLDGMVLPTEDCWLFDDDNLVLSVFSEDGRTGAFAQPDDAGLAAEYRTIRDALWPRSVPYERYVAGS